MLGATVVLLCACGSLCGHMRVHDFTHFVTTKHAIAVRDPTFLQSHAPFGEHCSRGGGREGSQNLAVIEASSSMKLGSVSNLVFFFRVE